MQIDKNSNKSIRDKVAVGLGSSLDWFDFALYGFFATTLAKLFFPVASQKELGIFYAFLTWFIGFAARPLGALIFGYIGDIYGRVLCFKITSILILFPAILLPLLPTYQDIGIVAPLILLLLRIIQGICIGGEFAGSIIYLCETSPKSRNYFFGSIGSCTGSFGILLASIVSSIIHFTFSQEDIEIYGWRIAFSIAIIISIISVYMRKTILETRIFNEVKHHREEMNVKSFSLFSALKSNSKQIVIACGIIYLHATSFYLLFIFFPTFALKYLNIESATTLTNNSILLAIRILIIPVIGLLADRIGGKSILKLSAILFGILSLPVFYVIQNYTYTEMYLATTLLALLTTLNAGCVPGLLMKIFPADTRYSSMSFSFNICFGLFGGIVPSLSIYLIGKFDSLYAPAYYLTIVSLITFFTLHYCVQEVKDGQNI